MFQIVKRNGGKYVTITGIIKKFNEYTNSVILENNTEIRIEDIIDISVKDRS